MAVLIRKGLMPTSKTFDQEKKNLLSTSTLEAYRYRKWGQGKEN